MLLIFVGTALVVGLFGGFVIGVVITRENYEKRGIKPIHEQQENNSTEQGTE